MGGEQAVPNAAPRVAVVGICGGMGQAHARALRQLGAGVVAGVDRAPNLPEVCADFGAEPLASHRDLMARRELAPDLVIVALPPEHHPGVAADLLRAGLPVLCEKPVACSVAAASPLSAATRPDSFFMAGHVLRFDPAMIALRRLIRSGRLGTVCTTTARKCWPAATSWRLGPGGGAVMIKDVHYWDLVPWLTGAAPVSLYAAGGDLFHGAGAEDAYHLILRLADGAIFHLESAWWTPLTSASAFEVVGPAGRAVVERDRIVVTDRAGQSEAIPLAGTDPLAAELAACLAAVRAGDPPPCGLADGLRAVAIGEAILASLRGGAVVATAPYLEAVP